MDVSGVPLGGGPRESQSKGKNFKIDPNLFLFHFGLVDLASTQENIIKNELLSSGWKGHFNRRMKLFNKIENQIPQEGDSLFVKARHYFTKRRKWFAWNKPAPLMGKTVIKIPKRFQTVV